MLLYTCKIKKGSNKMLTIDKVNELNFNQVVKSKRISWNSLADTQEELVKKLAVIADFTNNQYAKLAKKVVSYNWQPTKTQYIQFKRNAYLIVKVLDKFNQDPDKQLKLLEKINQAK